MSAKYYEQACLQGEGGNCKALLADALLYSGQYRRAQNIFESFLASSQNSHSEWSLKLQAIQFLRTYLDVDQQNRLPTEAIMPFNQCESFSDDEMVSAIDFALTKDALCGLAWFNMGVLKLKCADKADALLPFLLEALINPWDVEAWCNAMALSIPTLTTSPNCMHILKEAYRHNGQKFIDHVISFARSQPKEFPADTFVDVILQCLRELPQEDNPIVVRLLRGETDYDVIGVNLSSKK